MRSPRSLLTAGNLRAKKQLGQNFLNDPSVARAIVNLAGIGPDEVVLEIGPGLGAMTAPIAAAARRVIAVDKDARIVDLLTAELAAADVANVEIREGDILRTDLASVAREAGRPLVVLGNLPYNISSQVIVHLIHARSGIDRAVLMFQKEMARRLCAGSGSKDYGRLAVMLGYCASPTVLMQVSASRFFPVPKVASTVVGIRFGAPQELKADDEALLFRVVKAAFGKRRKTLKNALSQSDLGLLPDACERLLRAVEIDPMRRAERLSVVEFVRLSNVIGREKGKGQGSRIPGVEGSSEGQLIRAKDEVRKE